MEGQRDEQGRETGRRKNEKHEENQAESVLQGGEREREREETPGRTFPVLSPRVRLQ